MQVNINNSFLIGSWALKAYGLLTDRQPSDIDLLSVFNKENFILNNNQVEIYSTNDILSETNKVLYSYCENHSIKTIDTPIGKFKVAPLEVLKVLKYSSIPLKKAKHLWDLKKMEHIILSENLKKIADSRLNETLKRIEKDNFFNTYHIIRFIDHDELHRYVAKVPAYTKILDSSVGISQDKFNALSFEEKYLELFEEAFVLAMERELIIQYKQAPILLNTYLENFKDATDSSKPALRWLSRLSIPGRVHARPNWIAQWGQDHYHLFNHLYSNWWAETLENLSVEFWTRFLNIKNLEPLSMETFNS